MLHQERKSPCAAAALAVMFACAPLVLHAQTANEKTAGEKIDDAVTTGRVKSALLADESVKGTQIDVEVFRGVVQLNGFVDSNIARSRAVELARNINGVNEVRNNLIVDEGSRSAGQVVDDATLTAKVKTALAGDDRTSALQINVETRGGVVQLSGFVDSAEARSAAESLAGQVERVTRVENQLELKPPAVLPR